MNCQEIRELSSDYLDRQLGPHQVLLFEEHLEVCSNCRQEVETLRTTISLIGSLDEVKTSPDFLSQVHRKIEAGGKLRRLWAWFFEPFRLKVPLEVTALFLVSSTALYLYYRSPELSRESDIPAPLEGIKMAREKPLNKALPTRGRIEEGNRTAESETKLLAELKAKASKRKSSLEKVGKTQDKVAALTGKKEAVATKGNLQDAQVKPREEYLDRSDKDFKRYQMAEAKRPESLKAELSEPMDAEKKSSEGMIASVPKPEIYELTVGNVALYERRVGVLLKEVGGSLLSQEGSSESGLLLTVELPQSRQAEFLASLKEEVSVGSKWEFQREGAVGTTSGLEKELQEKNVITAGDRMLPSTSRMVEPTVKLQLRILSKK
ncbi:MAG: zf-HC2 domain-containing protein [Deltaproteobacteria bacterium]|nr:zf-HC2 domain-containing protein [Deltaproteobacteria bacterium]